MKTATELAQKIADQKLDVCCEWLSEQRWKNEALADAVHLRAARRPKPPSLKEQALEALDKSTDLAMYQREYDTIRRALEQLDD